jgi:tRNA-specific 2-thiouridylase
MYVTEIDSTTNTITIGTDADLYHRTLIASQVNWSGLAALNGAMRVQARVRYMDRGTDALVSLEENGNIKVTFDRPKRAITPGQSVVLYDGDDVVCGGVIDRVLD